MESGLPDIATWRRRIDDQSRIALSAAGGLSRQRRLEVDGLLQRLRGLDPRATLARGFAVVEHKGSGRALDLGGAGAGAGDGLDIVVSDGVVPAVVGALGDAIPPRNAGKGGAMPQRKGKGKGGVKPPPASAALL